MDNDIEDLMPEFVGVAYEMFYEFKRAVVKHGLERTPANPEMSNGERIIIIGEEFGEVCRAMTYDEGNRHELDKELVQLLTMVAATLVGNRLTNKTQDV